MPAIMNSMSSGCAAMAKATFLDPSIGDLSPGSTVVVHSTRLGRVRSLSARSGLPVVGSGPRALLYDSSMPAGIHGKFLPAGAWKVCAEGGPDSTTVAGVRRIPLPGGVLSGILKNDSG